MKEKKKKRMVKETISGKWIVSKKKLLIFKNISKTS